MGRLLLLRHGQSTWNADGRWQGWADPPLSPAGRAQAQGAAAWLAARGWSFAGVVASDLRRARHTAAILAAGLGLDPVAVEPDLRERDVGHWSGRTTEEIEAGWPGVLAEWRAGGLEGPPGGEAEARFSARVGAATERLVAGAAGDLLVVTHGGVIRALDRRLGATPCAAGNLCGRWVEADGDALRPGEAVAIPMADDSTTIHAL